jgi:hypothetical protein
MTSDLPSWMPKIKTDTSPKQQRRSSQKMLDNDLRKECVKLMP